MTTFVLTLIVLAFLNNFIKSPGKFINFLRKKNSRKITVKSKKYLYKDVGLGKFKLGKIVIKNMLKERFIYGSDACLPVDKYKENFLFGLENYLLYNFPNADIAEINRKLLEISEGNVNYWLTETRSYIRI